MFTSQELAQRQIEEKYEELLIKMNKHEYL